MYTPLKISKKQIIVDTDIGPDCDDAGSLSVLFTLAKKYDVPVAGIMHCCSNPYGAPAADVIATYFGYNVPIGTYEKQGFLDEEYCIKYNKYLSESFPRTHSEYPSQVKLYRKLLSQAEDGGVVLCTIGPLNNVSALIDSQPDEYSPLDGLTLFNKKVDSVVAMAGTFPEGTLSGREFNIVCDAAAAKNFFEKITPPVYFDGAELGVQIITGYTSPKGDENNPVRRAYRHFRPDTGLNASFDLLAVHFAFEGEGEYYSLSETGRFTVDVEGDGTSAFIPDENGNCRRMFFNASTEKITEVINSMLIGN